MTTAAATIARVPGLEDDEEGARIVAEELRLLTVLRGAVASREKEKVEGNDEDQRLIELREEISSAKPEDLPALFEQMHNLGALKAQRGKSAAQSLDLASPYFAHIRLEETFPGEKAPRRRDVLVGAKSYLDPRAGIRVVDWRHAPVSRIYYRYREGDDYEETLGDKLVEGRVLARRSVAIIGGELRRVSSPHGTFVRGGDGTWSRAHVAASRLFVGGGKSKLGVGADGTPRKDKLLPAIASMLDPAQFDLITKPGTGVVAIQGSAGSGKTTVGLHRVAYLNATDPSRFRAERMLIIVPTEALIHYTARVLPDLGVDGVHVSTFERWAQRVAYDLYPKLPSRLNPDTPPVVSRAKVHPAMLGAIDRLAARAAERVESYLAAQMAKWPGGDRVTLAWSKTKGAPDARVTELAQWVQGRRTIDAAGSASDLPKSTADRVVEIGPELRKRTRAILEAWDELCTSAPLLEETLGSCPGFGPGQRQIVNDWCVRQTRIRTEGERDGESASIDVEDMALLLRLFQAFRGGLIDGAGEAIRCAHLFIDEVQDASPVALRVLMDVAGANRSVTLAGDVAQRMLEDEDERGEFQWADLLRAAGVAEAAGGAMDPLKVSYRSTKPITAFARGVLGEYAHEAEPIAAREGPPVELFSFSSIGEAVAHVADALKELALTERDANVCVLTRFGPQADVYFEGLERAEVENVRRVRKQDFTWDRGVDVTDIRQTKGLEFDEVIVAEANATSFPETAQARHALYVGATRAAHQLWCVSSEPPSKVVEQGLEAMKQALLSE
jgi:DNA helicase-2/ATP-dependent DNA helicase PcrA